MKPTTLIIIFGLSFVFSMLLSFMLVVIMSGLFSKLIVGKIDDLLTLGIIILVFQFIFLFATSISLLFVSERIDNVNVVKAEIMAFATNLVVITLTSYFMMYFSHPEVFRSLDPLGILANAAKVIIDFSIYFFPHPFYFFISSAFLYIILYIFYLEAFIRGII